MNKSLIRLKQLVNRSSSYEQFKSNVVRFTGWYLKGLERWTNADLQGFYLRNGGK